MASVVIDIVLAVRSELFKLTVALESALENEKAISVLRLGSRYAPTTALTTFFEFVVALFACKFILEAGLKLMEPDALIVELLILILTAELPTITLTGRAIPCRPYETVSNKVSNENLLTTEKMSKESIVTLGEIVKSFTLRLELRMLMLIDLSGNPNLFSSL